jgi:rhodanese-related sulfurtransferase
MSETPELTPAEAAERLRDGWRLLDVREPDELAEARIEGAQQHIPLAELGVRAGEIGADRPLVVYCRSGVRSAMAVDALRGAGYDAHNLAGGILAWADAGLPVSPGDG